MFKHHTGISIQTKYQQSSTMQVLEIAYLDALLTKVVSKVRFWGKYLKFHIIGRQTAKNDFF